MNQLLYDTFPDNQLLLLLSQDDRRAFDALYERYWESLYKSAFYILKDSDAAKDIVQDVFVWLWQNRGSARIQLLQAYLKTAVRFKIANLVRAEKIRESFFEELAALQPADAHSSPETVAYMKQLNEVFNQAINSLPGKCQQIFRLSREENLSNQQIAQRLGISVKTVENQITIALRKVRSYTGSALSVAVLLSMFR